MVSGAGLAGAKMLRMDSMLEDEMETWVERFPVLSFGHDGDSGWTTQA